MEFVAKTLDDLLHKTYQSVVDNGQPVVATKGAALEMLGVRLELTNPRARLSRSRTRGQAFSALGEFLWYLAGTDDSDYVSHYIKAYAELAVDGKLLGAYGPRLFGDGADNQLSNVIELLKAKRSSRQAVIQLFDRHDLLIPSKDIPCTCSLQFLVRGEKVHLVVYMRSNDIYLGLPHDVFAFTMLQELVARSIEADVGSYVHMVGSLHLYDRDKDSAQGYLNEGWQVQDEMPSMPSGSPWTDVECLLAQEREIRLNGEAAPKAIALGSGYWDDLVRLLLAVKSHDAAELDAISDTLGDPYYSIYIKERFLRKEVE